MSYKKKQQTAFNWETYFNNLKERAKATFVITDSGDSFHLYEGLQLSEEEFKSLLPIELIRYNLKGDNKDGTHVK